MRRVRARLVAAGVVTATIVVACSYQAPSAPSDAATDGPPILPDAGPCATASKTCFGDGSGGEVLRTCNAAGAPPLDTPCPWGCLETDGAHCGALQPSGGAVTAMDLLPVQGQTLGDVTMDDEPTIIDTVTGEITGLRAPGSGLLDGIEFIIRNNVGIFRFKSLTIADVVVIRGANGVALVALESITVDEEIDLRDCANPNVAQGGFTGGAPNTIGNGPGGGAGGGGGNDDSSGGGGGGHAGGGGSGGRGQTAPATDGGLTFGTERIEMLLGGAGGGGGGATGGRGGNGGGAIQLASSGAITFSSAGRINAGGCGGQSGQDQRAAGGGGAGGAILIEGLTIMTTGAAVLAVNGGGGGGGDRPSEGAENGENAKFSATAAFGGAPGNNGGSGGDGASDATLTGSIGQGGGRRNGGGGGGGVGWIRLHTKSGTATLDATTIISPAMTAGSPASQGSATVQ